MVLASFSRNTARASSMQRCAFYWIALILHRNLFAEPVFCYFRVAVATDHHGRFGVALSAVDVIGLKQSAEADHQRDWVTVSAEEAHRVFTKPLGHSSSSSGSGGRVSVHASRSHTAVQSQGAPHPRVASGARRW